MSVENTYCTNRDNGSFKAGCLVTGSVKSEGDLFKACSRGCHSVCWGRNLDNATSVAKKQFTKRGRNSHLIDVTKKSLESLRTIADEHGKVDVLVNCAGGSTQMLRLSSEQLVELIDNMIKQTYVGVYYVAARRQSI